MPPRIALLDTIVTALQEAQSLPGVAIAVVRRGEIIHAQGYGYASLELGSPVTPETVFCIGSLTKQFTAAAILQRIEAGDLMPDTPILPHFPELISAIPHEFREAWERITVRHLLTHTSGIKRDPIMFRPTENTLPPDYIPVLYAWARQEFTPRSLLEMIAALPLDFTPGEKQSYSNAGYTLLGMLLERITDLSYADYLQMHILAPLGMTATRLIEEDVVPRFATGYTRTDNDWRRGGYINPSRDRAAGSLVSTILDLARWDAALYSDVILSRASRDSMWAPASLKNGTPLPYGFGWSLGEREGRRWVGHGGMWGGFTAYLLRLLDEALTVIALTNLGISGRVPNGGQRGEPGLLAWEIAQHFIPYI